MRIQLPHLTLSVDDYSEMCSIRDALNARIKELVDAVPLNANEQLLVASGKKIDAVKALRQRMSDEGRESGLKLCKDVVWAYADEDQRKNDMIHAMRTMYRDIQEAMQDAWRRIGERHPEV